MIITDYKTGAKKPTFKDTEADFRLSFINAIRKGMRTPGLCIDFDYKGRTLSLNFDEAETARLYNWLIERGPGR